MVRLDWLSILNVIEVTERQEDVDILRRLRHLP